MRRCSNCNRIFPASADYSFCRYDGTPLLSAEELAEAETLSRKGESTTDSQLLNPRPAASQNSVILEKAILLETEFRIKSLRANIPDSPDGPELAANEVATLLALIEIQVREITDSAPSLGIELIVFDPGQAALVGSGYGIKISWQQPYAHVLQDSILVVVEYKRAIEPDTKEKEFERLRFRYDIDSDFRVGWRQQEAGNVSVGLSTIRMGAGRIVTSEALASECIDRLIGLIETERD